MSKLVIPIDVSQVKETDRGQQKVRVAAKIGEKVVSQVVSVKAGKAEVTLDVDAKQPLTLAIGPDNVSDQELFNFQTLTTAVNPAQWANKATLTAPTLHRDSAVVGSLAWLVSRLYAYGPRDLSGWQSGSGCRSTCL
jgi:hypothetical protein